MTQKAVRVEDRPWKQAVSIFTRHELASMKMSGKDEVVAGIPGFFPDSRVMTAKDADMRIDALLGVRAGDRDHSVHMRHALDAVMDPLSSAADDGLTNEALADLAVVVATNGKNGREIVKFRNQVTQLAQLGGAVHKIAAQQHDIWIASSRGIQDLPAQSVCPAVSEVNVADIQQPICIMPRRESLFADVQSVIQPDLQRSSHQELHELACPLEPLAKVSHRAEVDL
jgi:hypothetical protein